MKNIDFSDDVRCQTWKHLGAVVSGVITANCFFCILKDSSEDTLLNNKTPDEDGRG
jgi:hypothetical protein